MRKYDLWPILAKTFSEVYTENICVNVCVFFFCTTFQTHLYSHIYTKYFCVMDKMICSAFQLKNFSVALPPHRTRIICKLNVGNLLIVLAAPLDDKVAVRFSPRQREYSQNVSEHERRRVLIEKVNFIYLRSAQFWRRTTTMTTT